jgi:hypothetical protein
MVFRVSLTLGITGAKFPNRKPSRRLTKPDRSEQHFKSSAPMQYSILNWQSRARHGCL